MCLQVPGLFTPEELAKELAPLEKQKDEDPMYQGPPSTYAYFIHRIRQGLHIAVSMDPSADSFRQCCEANPALTSLCSVQWLEGWSDKGMTQIAAVRLQEALKDTPELAGKGSDDLAKRMLSLHMGMTLTAESRAAPPPRQFFAFAGLYGKLFGQQHAKVLEQKNFLQGGLSKLAEAAGTVDDLSRAVSNAVPEPSLQYIILC